ncbi:MAG: TolC family protein [Bacteroidetes bacterium]|nr:TolC family protein [Bacteroidota bacterium]MBU1718774.1 TolC family protein [Bacteroidota bacterium]
MVSAFLAVVQPLKAQEYWDLQKCIGWANDHNIQIRQQLLQAKLEEASLLQSRLNLFPTLNGQITNVFNYGKSVDQYTNSFANDRVRSNNMYLSSSVTLFSGFQKFNAIQQSKLNLEAAKYDTDKLRNDISLSIATAYLQILYNREVVAMAEQQLSNTILQADRTKILVDAKALTLGNLLEIQAQVANDELNLVNARNQMDLSYLNLKQLLDLDTISDFQIAIPEITVEPKEILIKPDFLYSVALNRMPQVKSSEIKVESAKAGISISKGMMSPTLSLQGSVGTGYSEAAQDVNMSFFYDVIGYTMAGDSVYGPGYDYSYKDKPFGDQINDNVNKSVGLYLSIPIFNGYQARTAISRSKIAYMTSLLSYDLTKNMLRKEIEQAYNDAVAGYKKYMATQKAITSMEESFSYTQKKFDVGAVNSTDYNIAKNQLLSAKSQFLQAKYDYIFKTKVLDFYQGNPITLK